MNTTNPKFRLGNIYLCVHHFVNTAIANELVLGDSIGRNFSKPSSRNKIGEN